MTDKRTRKWNDKLPSEFRGKFDVIADAMEWRLIPSITAKPFLFAYEQMEKSIYIFTMNRGMLSASVAEPVKIPLVEVEEIKFKRHLITASIHIHMTDGTRMRLKIPGVAKTNGRAIFESIEAARSKMT